MSSASSWGHARIAARLMLVALLALPAAGCFQPLYAERNDGAPSIREKLAAVEVPPVDTPNGQRIARLGVEIRNALMFKMYGGATGTPPTHSLKLTLTTGRSSLIVDPTTQQASVENFGIDASYTLKDVATGAVVLSGNTFSRVEYDVPGQQQRFARARAYRDAEDRASKEIAENIQTRLAAFFYAGT